MCVFLCVCACVRECVCAHMRMFADVCAFVFMGVVSNIMMHACDCVCLCICVCMCIYALMFEDKKE